MGSRIGFGRRGRGFRITQAAWPALIVGALALALSDLPARSAPPGVRLVQAAPALFNGDIVGRASVIDGDTIEIHGTRIRFAGIDAPERGQICGRARVGREAAFALDRLIGGRSVSCWRRGEDAYGRTLAECRAGGADISTAMVRAGWAWDYARYSGGRYAGAEREARAESQGVWAYHCEPAWVWRRQS